MQGEREGGILVLVCGLALLAAACTTAPMVAARPGRLLDRSACLAAPARSPAKAPDGGRVSGAGGRLHVSDGEMRRMFEAAVALSHAEQRA